jgi:outer membrane protein OmpA-like peptidoglycan-associated protein
MGSSRHAMSLTVLALFAGMGLPLTARAQAPSGAAAGGLSPDGPAQVSSDAAPPVGGTPAAPAAPAASATPATPAAAAAPAPALGVPEGAAEQKPASGDEEAAVTSEWAARDTSLNESNTITGGTGLLRTQHAQSGAPAQFRLGIISEWYTGGFLCTAKFPCLNPAGSQTTSDSLNHFGGTISLGTSLFKIGEGTFEAYASTEAIANSDAANRPSLLQVFGDTNLAVKYGAPVGDVMHLGLFTELWLVNGTGSVGLAGKGTSAKFGGIATADMRGLESSVPLRLSANVVYSVDNTGTVVTDTENARAAAAGSAVPVPITRIERYGLGINRVDHVDFYLGGEVFVADDRARPFLETHIMVPTNRQGYACLQSNSSHDNCLALDKLVPATLTIGSRFYPWKRGFSLLAALDIALSGSSDFIEEVQPLPPWTLFIGAGWATDTTDRPPVFKTKIVEKAVEKYSARHVTGFVHEKDKNDPIPNAIVTYRDHAELAPLATGPDGKFGDDVAPGQYTYDVKADTYKPGSCDVTVPKEGGELNIDCPLEPLPRVGTVAGHVRDALTSEPIAGVQIVLADSQHKEYRINADASGGFRFESVAPGTATVDVTADGYLALVSPADVKVRQENQVDLMLRPTPKKPNVVITGREITIKQQIQFALDSAVILPESFGLLTEIADTLIRHAELKRVEVQGHTDNSGTADHNKILSEQRAQAVVAWLLQHGVTSDRLIPRGYGQEKPLVPNVTAGYRAQNRRVQFIILEKEGGPPPPSTGAGPAGAGPAAGERKKNPLPGF